MKGLFHFLIVKLSYKSTEKPADVNEVGDAGGVSTDVQAMPDMSK